MKHVIYLAWRYLSHNRVKTTVLVASIGLIMFLPAALQVLARAAAEILTTRADATPLITGSRGSGVDLTLSALYFKAPSVEPMPYREVSWTNATGLATAIPLHLRYSAGGHRIVGTSIEYLEFRGLRFAEGRAMATLGECVLGAGAAVSLGASVGDSVLTSPAGAFDVGGSFPLKMRVVGVLVATHSPDDDVVLTDVGTTWVIAGIAHGHEDVTAPSASNGVLSRDEDNVVANASVLPYTEITSENVDSFHFHGDRDRFPVDAAIVVPIDRRSGVLLRGRYSERAPDVQVLVPRAVVDEVVETMFSIRDAVFLVSLGLGAATLATATLVFALSIELRRREIETIRKIGAPRGRWLSILAAEIVIVLFASAAMAVALTGIASRYGSVLLRMATG